MPPSLTVNDYLEQWLKDIDGSVRPKTLHQYSGVVRNHLNPRLGNLKLQELQSYHIQMIYTEIKKQGHSPRNIQLVHSVMHRALAVAEKQGLIGRNPANAVIRPKVTHKEMKVFDDNQARQFLITAQGDRYEALFHLAITTGIRQGELLGLKWIDVDWACRPITHSTKSSTGTEKRVCFFSTQDPSRSSNDPAWPRNDAAVD